MEEVGQRPTSGLPMRQLMTVEGGDACVSLISARRGFARSGQ
jgi:hypothetical protein